MSLSGVTFFHVTIRKFFLVGSNVFFPLICRRVYDPYTGAIFGSGESTSIGMNRCGGKCVTIEVVSFNLIISLLINLID